MTSLSVRLPEETARALEELARDLDRPKTFIVRKALENYMAEYADYQIALDRLRDKGDDIISAAELRRRLAGSD